MTDVEANGHSAANPLPVLLTAADIPLVDFDLDMPAVIGDYPQIVRDLAAVIQDGLWILGAAGHRKDDDMGGREPWWQEQAIVIAVGHHHGADQPRRDAPRCCPAVFEFAFLALVRDVLHLGKVLPEKVRSASLKRLAILHHCFDAERLDGPRESLARGLLSGEHRHRHPVVGEVRVDIKHALGFFDRLFLRSVRGVTFLPQEFAGSKEQPRSHLPSHDIGPLVDKQREVAIGLDPPTERVADDGFACWTNDERLFEFACRHEPAVRPCLKAVVRHDGTFLGEAVDVLGFLLKKSLRNQQREVGIAVPRGLEHAVENPLEVLPEGVAPWLDHHASADRGVFRQIGFPYDLLIPLGIVLIAGGCDRRLCLGRHGGEDTRTSGDRGGRSPLQSHPVTKITATIITLNETHNLQACVESLSGLVDEVLVLDSCSTDGTQDLARSLGAVVHEQPYAGNGPQRIRASELASNDWILAIDADERLEPDLQEWLREVNFERDHCYAFRRRNFLGDRWIKAAGFYPDEVIRLYNRRTAEYLPSTGHSRVAGSATAVSVKAHLRHLTFRDMDHWLQCLEWMTTRDAEAYVESGRQVGPLAPLAHAIVACVRKLIGKGGAFQGRDGWRIARMATRRAWMKYSKIRVLQRTRPAE